jgi:hypothetical protein
VLEIILGKQQNVVILAGQQMPGWLPLNKRVLLE